MKFPRSRAAIGRRHDAAMDHLMHYGSYRSLTDEELVNVIEIDPSQISGLGPSIDSLIALLEERKRKILETYDPSPALVDAQDDYVEAVASIDPPTDLMKQVFDRAVGMDSIPALESLWYQVGGERSPLGPVDAVDLEPRNQTGDRADARHVSLHRIRGVTPSEAVEIKEMLDQIEALLEQLREARKNARVGIIDMEALRSFVDEASVEELQGMQKQIQDMVREQAEQAGLEAGSEGYQLGSQALRTIQGKLLDEIFSELEASRSGRHDGPVVGGAPSNSSR